MTDSAIKYVGVDGCKAGWIGIGLADDGDCWEVKASIKFSELIAHFKDACVILVDVPIGLVENIKDVKPGGRDCDKKARKKLGSKRQSSVFSAPSTEFVKAVMENPCWDYENSKKWLEQFGKEQKVVGVSRQTFAITRKIGEVREVLSLLNESVSSKVREAHPEVCFWALKGKRSMSFNKREDKGREERLDALRCCAQYVNGIVVNDIRKEARYRYTKTQVADDDILDALALAITAKIVSRNPGRLGTLPDKPPTDNSKKKLPMEMVYALPNDEGTPC